MKLLASGLLALLSTVACGSLSDGDHPALLATIQGRLTNAESVDVPDTIRVAVLWQSALDAGNYVVAQDIAVEPVFPSKFRLALTVAPPAAALVTEDGPQAAPERAQDPTSPGSSGDDGDDDDTSGTGGTAPTDGDSELADGAGPRLALGFLVAYDDTNGNGKLDLVNEGAQFTDRILGANQDLLVLYAEGNVEQAGIHDYEGNPLRAGYGLFRLEDPCADRDPESNAPLSECEERIHFSSIDGLYELPLSSDPEFSELMCANGGGHSETTGGGASRTDPGEGPNTDPGPEGYPAPGPDVDCASDGRKYTQSTCTTTELGPCRGSSTQCVLRDVSLPPGAVPAGWPCTLPQ